MITEPLLDTKTLQIYEALWKEKGADYIMERLIEEMAGLTSAIIGTRHNHVTFSYAVFEGMANVEIYMDILRARLCTLPQSDGTGCLYNDALKIKARLFQEEIIPILKNGYPIINNCPYRKQERDMGCPCEDNVEIQPCEKLKRLPGDVM